MKKAVLMIVLVSLLSLSLTGCFGSFTLSRKVYDFNASMGDKFLQSIVMWVFWIAPVYGTVMFIDVAVLNLIEFWSGSNPLAMNENDSEQRFYTHEGVTYEVITTKNRYDIKDVDNPENSVSFVYENSNSTWNLHSNGQVYKIAQDNQKELKLFNPEGKALVIIYNN